MTDWGALAAIAQAIIAVGVVIGGIAGILELRLRVFFAPIEKRMDSMDIRMDSMEKRLDSMDGRLERIEQILLKKG